MTDTQEYHKRIIEVAGDNIGQYRLFLADGVITDQECNNKVEAILGNVSKMLGHRDLEDRILRRSDEFVTAVKAARERQGHETPGCAV